MRRWAERAALGPDLGGHQAFGAGAEAHQDELAGAQFRHAEASERFHVHENVGRALPAG